MSSKDIPSVTISYAHGSWQWDDGTAACHGHGSAAEAAADWQRDSEWRAARATAGSPAGQAPRACYAYSASAAEAATAPRTCQAGREMAADERDMRECDAAVAARYRRDPWV